MHRFSYSFLPHTKDPKNAYFRAFWQKVFRTAFCIKPFNRFLPSAASWTSLGIRVNLRFLFVPPLIGVSTLLPMLRGAFSALFGMMGGGLLVGKRHAQSTQPLAAGVVHATMRSADAWISTVSQLPCKQQLAAVRQRGRAMFCSAPLKWGAAIWPCNSPRRMPPHPCRCVQTLGRRESAYCAWWMAGRFMLP